MSNVKRKIPLGALICIVAAVLVAVAIDSYIPREDLPSAVTETATPEPAPAVPRLTHQETDEMKG